MEVEPRKLGEVSRTRQFSRLLKFLHIPLMICTRPLRSSVASSAGRWKGTRESEAVYVWSMCTRWTGPRATPLPGLRLSPAPRRIVWSKMKILDAPVLVKPLLAQIIPLHYILGEPPANTLTDIMTGVTTGRQSTYASFSSCSVSA